MISLNIVYVAKKLENVVCHLSKANVVEDGRASLSVCHDRDTFLERILDRSCERISIVAIIDV
jgi:hypothetical protein